ncbi:MAG TPA: CusA/CzcA family heavy metal efflux RND transporter [Gemmatimonadaceae bacterium]|jgi:heavy metal efflux pump (cobalt-zinc-cadmium)
MLNKLISFALRQRAFVLGGVLTLVLVGVWAMNRLPFDAYPDLTGTTVEVITEAPGLAPEEVERLVTYPVEWSLMGLQGAGRVRSVSKYGLSIVIVPFPDKMDVYFARTLVQQRLAEVTQTLPEGIEPVMGPVSTPMGELYQYTLTSDSLSLAELKTLHDYTIRPRLRTVPGVSEVNSWGGYIDQLQVDADPVRLASYGLTLDDVHDALQRNNTSFGGSYIERAGERYTLQGLGRFGSADDIARVVITAHDGTPVRIGDVGTVRLGALPREGAVTQDGNGEVVSGMVLKLKGADSRRVIERVKARMAEIESTLPASVHITPFYDQTELVSRTTNTIIKNLVEGGLLVVAVLFLFLRNLRASLIVASVIPLSMLFAFTGMYAFGYSANLMSLGALDFGLIVDASVVLVENFIRKLEDDPTASGTGVFHRAALEVARPILFGIAIIMAVYIPIFTLDGMEGRMFIPMAFTVVVAVLGSLLLALTYVPSISSLLLRHTHEKPNRWMQSLRTRYSHALAWALEHTALVVGGAALALGIALFGLMRIGTEFMPRLDEGSILINTLRSPSISLGDATHLSSEAERIVRGFPEVKTVVTKEGRPDLATEAMGLYEGDMYVILHPREEWTTAHTHEGLVAAFDSALSVVPGLRVSFTQPLAMRLDEAESGIKTDLGIKVVGPDIEQNQLYAEKIRRVLAATPGAADVGLEVGEGTGQITLSVKRDELARYGLSVDEVRSAIELSAGARVATELVDGPRRIDVVVRLPESMRNDPVLLERLTVRSSGGELVPLGAVVDIVSGTGPALIGHEDAQRRTLVFSNVRGRDLGGFVSDVRQRVANQVTLPAGMFLEWGGQYENQQRAMQRLEVVVPLALVLIYLLLFASFRSVPLSLLVLANVPFALVGGVAMLWLRGLNLSLSASIGFIALFGIAVLNGLVLVTHLNEVREGVGELRDAVITGASDRLRPVLMTALVASLGFVPMALSTSPGAEVQRPLASVVIGGLVTSTFLTLFVMPSLYLALERWRAARRETESETSAAIPEPAMASVLNVAIESQGAR